MHGRIGWFGWLLLLTLPASGSAQEVEEYFDQLSTIGPPVEARSGTEAFGVYDPGSPTTDFVRREYWASLRALAARFSPILKTNNGSVPQEVLPALTRGGHPPLLHIDAWNTAGHDPERVGRWSIDLRELRADLARSVVAGTGRTRMMDSVWTLVTSHGPGSASKGSVNADSDTTYVFYLDFPGRTPEEWRRAHIESDEIRPHAYVHFFVHDERPLDSFRPPAATTTGACGPPEGAAVSSLPRYSPVLQYWLFYPFNDGVNNHEGDWEHINVILSTPAGRRRGTGLLTHAEVCALLTDSAAASPDSTEAPLIWSVDYYFHHSVLTLDYDRAYLDQDDRNDTFRTIAEGNPEWIGQEWLYDRLAERVDMLAQFDLTRPVAYVGGNSVGLDVLISPPGNRDRNPHGSYPFPGVWKHVGPLGSSERLHGDQKGLRELASEMGVSGGACPEPSRERTFACFDEESLTLLPDWEVFTRPENAWRGFWMVLPIRWGFPVTESPGGGLVPGLNVGQEAPVGPSYSSGWNRRGATRGFGPYRAHVLAKTFQTGVQEGFGPNRGFLNWADLTLLLPPLNAARMVWLYGRGWWEGDWRQFNPRPELPARHQALVFGTRGVSSLDADWTRTLPLLREGAGGQIRTPADGDVDSAPIWQVGLASYYGRLGSEVSYSWTEHRLQGSARPSGAADFVTTTGTVELQELRADVRWSLLRGGFEPFVTAGYGWTWTRMSVDRVETNSVSAGPGSIWPNTVSAGIGSEVFLRLRKDAGVSWSNLDLSARVTLARTWQGLPIFLGETRDVAGRSRGLGLGNVSRDRIQLGFALGF